MKATRVRIFIFGALAAGWMLATPYEASAGLLVGGALTVTVDDSPISTDFSQTVTLGASMTTLDQGEMTLAQTLVSTGPNTQWLVLDFEATGGLLLAGNLGGYWAIDTDPALSSPAGFTGIFGYWSVNGVAEQPNHSYSRLWVCKLCRNGSAQPEHQPRVRRGIRWSDRVRHNVAPA